MTDQHPITPPLALIDQWWDEAKQNAKYDEPIGPLVATQAARWGADQMEEACFAWLALNGYGITASRLRAAMLPKPPPTLKERIAAAITAGDERSALSLLNEALPE